MKNTFMALFLSVFVGTQAAGDSIHIFKTGRVTSINAGFDTGIQIGDQVEWEASFDPTATDLDPDPARVFLEFSADDDFFIHTRVTTSTGILSFDTGFVWVWDYDHSSDPEGDVFEVSGGNQPKDNWPASLLTGASSYQLTFLAKQQTAPFDMVDGINVPVSGMPDLTLADSVVGEIRALGGNNPYEIFWTPDTEAVPEVSSSFGLMIVAGLIAICQGRKTGTRCA